MSADKNLKNAPYKNPELSVEKRTGDLIGRMSPLEKACQLSTVYAFSGSLSDMDKELEHGIGQVGMSSGRLTAEMNAELVNTIQHHLAEKTRLGIPAIFHVETLNGGSIAEASTYPVPIGLAATWDTKKVEQMAEDIRKEMSACGMHLALAPVLDISRDPRWGRMGETYGESPALTSAMGVAYVKGIQGDNARGGLSACAKHFLGYAASEGGLNMSGAHIGPRELREVYAKPFEAAIHKAGLKGIMNCYLAIDGEPVTGSKKYLTDLLRGELGFTGLTVADYGSIDKLCDVFGIAKDKAEAGAMALEAGLDTETPRRICLGDDFVSRLEAGEIAMEIVDAPLRRLLSLKFEMGLFENPYVNEDAMKAELRDESHKQHAYQLACESMVLLKNDKDVLPLKSRYKKIAVIGPCGDTGRALFGGYTYPAFYESVLSILTGMARSMGLQGVEMREGMKSQLEAMLSQFPPVEQLIVNNYPGVVTVFDALKTALEQHIPGVDVNYARGCGYMGTSKTELPDAVELAGKSDIVILLLGGKNGSGAGCTMGENVDSSNIGLPGIQEELAKEIKATGKPVVLVHIDGRPLSSVWAKENADSILEAWHPGQRGAQAIADTLIGKNNPCGKLPVTVLRHASQVQIYAEQHRGSGVQGRGMSNNDITQGYVEEPGFALFPFGYGLSYAKFEITDCAVSQAALQENQNITVSCAVTNVSDTAGDEIVQLYFSDRQSAVTRPNKELAGFCRVSLNPGESGKVLFTFTADQTAFLDKDMRWKIEAGDVDILIGNSSDALNLAGTVEIVDTRYLPDSKRNYYSDVVVNQN
jgi:beta-glucosidase